MNISQVKSVSVICLGNICRSPIGEVVLKDRFKRNNIDIEVCSGGTGSWHVGENANRRTIQVLEENNYKIRHSARQIKPSWFKSHDLFLAMDSNNYLDLQKIGGFNNYSKIKMFRRYDPMLKIASEVSNHFDVPDPYYGNIDDFRSVLSMIENAADGLVERMING